jgi:hypothetical protein
MADSHGRSIKILNFTEFSLREATMKSDQFFNIKLVLGLVLLMVLTRYSAFHTWGLPSATLAVFFIAGIYLRQYAYPVLLLATAGFTDYFSIQAGTSDWCITPAYMFLIPTYLCLWFAGRQFDDLQIRTPKEFFHLALFVLLSSTAAFIISTGSYHLLSGRYDDVPILDQVVKSMKYYPRYIGGVLFYVGIFLVSVNVKPYLVDISNRQMS